MANPRRVSRREFLEQAGMAAGALALAPTALSAARPALPPPSQSGIDHIIVVMMENRSFDHMLGWLPGADGRQSGLAYVDTLGVSHSTFPLAPDFQGCGHPDPDHTYLGGRLEFNGGLCDGWLRAGLNDEYAIGYYVQNDLPFFGRAALDWTVCDQYFSPIMAPTFPNRLYQHAAQTDRLNNTFEFSLLPTIWDRLIAAGVSARYYFQDAPFLGLWGLKYFSISRRFDSFLEDCADGTLPHVSFVEPRFIEEETGTSNDDHPHADIRDGQVFLNRVYSAVTNSPAWKRSVLVITYDEWGGFFDHVAPAAAAIPPATAAALDIDGLRGFRVPCLIVSPYARRGFVSNTLFDHTSVLRFIEWRWGLEPLTVRDATANNLAEALDLRKLNRKAPTYAFDEGPYASFCAPFETDKWSELRDIVEGIGWLF